MKKGVKKGRRKEKQREGKEEKEEKEGKEGKKGWEGQEGKEGNEGNEGKEGKSADADSFSDSSSSSDDDDPATASGPKDTVATGCFLGAGTPWWQCTQQTTTPGPPNTATATATAATATAKKQLPTIVVGVVHHVFVVGATTNRMSIARIKCRHRNRHDHKNQHLDSTLPTAGLDVDDRGFLSSATVVQRNWSSLAKTTHQQMITTCTDLSSREMIICGAGHTVLGLSVHTLDTLFAIDFSVLPTLEVDQVTACSMIAWHAALDSFSSTPTGGGSSTSTSTGTSTGTNSRRNGGGGGGGGESVQPVSIVHVHADDVTGMVLACAADGKCVKICLKIKSMPKLTSAFGTSWSCSNTAVGRNSNNYGAKEEESPKTIVEAWSTLIFNRVLAKQLSFMSTTESSDKNKDDGGGGGSSSGSCSGGSSGSSGGSSNSNSNTSSGWSSFISCNGNGYQDENDVTLSVGDGFTGVRILVMSQKNKPSAAASSSTSSTLKDNANPSTTEQTEERKDTTETETESGNVRRTTTTTSKATAANTTATTIVKKKVKRKKNAAATPPTVATPPTAAAAAAASVVPPLIPSDQKKKKTTKARRSAPLHFARLWLPENFASDGVVKVDHIVKYTTILESMIMLDVVAKLNTSTDHRLVPEWKTNATSPDGKLLLLVCCLHVAEGSQEGEREREVGVSCDGTYFICWDVRKSRLLSMYDLSCSGGGGGGGGDGKHNWTMTYDLRTLKHNIHVVQRSSPSSAQQQQPVSLSLPREIISVDPGPYIRSTTTQKAMAKLLLEKR